MVTLILLIALIILVGVIVCTLSDLILLTVAICAGEKLFYRFKKRYIKMKKK